MPNIRLVAVDEDGTFLRGHRYYDKKRFARIFDRMCADGVRFVVATGNHRYQVESLFPEYASRMGIVSVSGAYVVDRGEDVFVARADEQAVAHMVDACHADRTVPFAVIGAKSAYVEYGTSQDFFDDMALYNKRIQWIDDFAHIDDRILMFSSVVEEERVQQEIDRYREVVGDYMDVVGSGEGYFDVMCPGVNKATGLKALLDRYGIDPKDCVAFGDSDNDLDMLRFVGHSYAMQNASSNVKAMADHVAPSCDDNGVLQVLEELFA